MLRHITQARIALRLPALIVVALLACLVAASSVYYLLFKAEIRQQNHERALLLAGNVQTVYETWLGSMFRTIEDLADSRLAPDAMRNFNEALALQAPGWLDEIRAAYTDQNPQPVGQRSDFERGASRPAYDAVHEAFNRDLRAHRDRFHYYDLFLISTSGQVIYTVDKEPDFGTDLVSGPWRDTELARVWREAMSGPEGTTAFADFAPYAPSNDAPAAFIARRITDRERPGAPVIGVVVMQLPTDTLGQALSRAGNMTGQDEAYLLGDQGHTRNAARVPGGFDMFAALPNLPQTRLAMSGQDGYLDNVEGVHGERVDVAVQHFTAWGHDYTAVVELDRAEAYAILGDFFQRAAMFTILGIIASLAVGWAVARSITRPLRAFAGSMQALADERYEDEVAGLDRFDEIGELSRGLDTFRLALAAAAETEKEQQRARAEQAQVVADLGRGMRDLASGHLDIRLENAFSEGYEQLRSDFNETVDTMETLMRSITTNAGEIRARAEEISASADDLSQRTETQASTLEQTAAALNELTTSVRAAAEGASEVAHVVADARQEAEQSGQVVSEAVIAMSLIRKSSNEISQITGVIDDIAFQTNLLALNAGVEAARAGESGRGFAVVATEVRALAQRSSDAAKQIKALITGSTEHVETGVGLVGRAGERLSMIIERVGNIDKLVDGIASGAREQSAGLNEINTGVGQLDQVTQQNAAMVEDVSAAAVTLNSESLSLSRAVGRFRLRGAAAPLLVPVPAVPLIVNQVPGRGARPDTPARPSVLTTAPQTEPADEFDTPIAANMARWQDF